MLSVNKRKYDELREPHDDRKFIVVAFWGVETEREFHSSRRAALQSANEKAANGADVHVAEVLGEAVINEEAAAADSARAKKAT